MLNKLRKKDLSYQRIYANEISKKSAVWEVK